MLTPQSSSYWPEEWLSQADSFNTIFDNNVNSLNQRVAFGSDFDSLTPVKKTCSSCANWNPYLQNDRVVVSNTSRYASTSRICLWLLIFLVSALCVQCFGSRIYRSASRLRALCTSRYEYAAPHKSDYGVNAPSPVPAAQAGARSETQGDKIIPEGDGVTFAFFHAPWCGHCRTFKPIFEQIARESARPNLDFVMVESDVLQKSPHIDKIGVDAFPTIIVFKGSAQVAIMVGAQGEVALRKLVSEHAFRD